MKLWNRQTYYAFMAHVEYFRWSACKGFPSAGNDPTTGLAKIGDQWRAAGRKSHIAQARYFLGLARTLRTA